MREELTGRLHQVRQLLGTLPDLGDRPHQPAEPAVAPEAVTQPASTPATAPETTPAPAPAAEAPVRRPSPTPHASPSRGESEAARQQITSAQHRSPETRQLPMPPRPGAGGSTAASSPANPPTQAIDQPAQSRS